MADNKFHTGRVLANMERLKAELPTVLANQAKNFFTDSWKNEGWEGQKWPEPKRKQGLQDSGDGERKRDNKGRFAGTNATRKTLVRSGALRRAVGMSIRVKTFERIELVVALPYAAIHNEGGQGLAFGKYAFKMPQRKFMGDSPTLRAKQIEKIHSFIDKIWRE